MTQTFPELDELIKNDCAFCRYMSCLGNNSMIKCVMCVPRLWVTQCGGGDWGEGAGAPRNFVADDWPSVNSVFVIFTGV